MRFREGKIQQHDYLAQKQAGQQGQLPVVAILSYIDSQAPAEILLDVGLGYTGSGLLNEEIGFDNVKTTYHYDACGRLSEKHEYGNDHQSPPFITQYQRDPMGRLSEVLDGENPLAWQYDEAGRLEAEHQSWATMRYRYDEDTGRLTGIKQPNGQWQEFHYQHGKLQASSLEGQPLTAYGYDHHQRLQQLRQGNRLVNSFQYDPLAD